MPKTPQHKRLCTLCKSNKIKNETLFFYFLAHVTINFAPNFMPKSLVDIISLKTMMKNENFLPLQQY